LGIVSIYVLPQLISASEIGLLRLLMSFSWMTAVLMPFGVGSITLRYFPKIKNTENGHHGFFALLFILSTLGAIIVSIILLFNANAFTKYYQNSPEFSKYFHESLVYAYILSLITVYNIYSASQFKTSFTVFLSDVFARIGQLFVVVLYYYHLISQQGLIWSYIVVSFFQLLFLVSYLWRSGFVSFKINFSFYKTLPLKEISAFGLLMMMTAFASLGIKQIDQLMIGHFLNSEQVGIYATCVMMTVVMEIPFNSLERIASPKISYAWSIGDKLEVSKIYEMSSRYMFFTGAVLFCVLWYGIDFILHYLPPQYNAGRAAFYIVTFSSLFNLLTGINSSVILYSHKYFAASTFLLVLIAVGVIANYFLIPLYGITGAAIATLIAIGSFNLLKYIYILLRFQMQPFTKYTAYILLATVISVSLTLIFPSTLHPFFKALIGGAFTMVVFSILNIKAEVIHEINKVFKRFGIIRK
jgi:O-antigen/teichoic acid export membrane protein